MHGLVIATLEVTLRLHVELFPCDSMHFVDMSKHGALGLHYLLRNLIYTSSDLNPMLHDQLPHSLLGN